MKKDTQTEGQVVVMMSRRVYEDVIEIVRHEAARAEEEGFDTAADLWEAVEELSLASTPEEDFKRALEFQVVNGDMTVDEFCKAMAEDFAARVEGGGCE